MMTKSESAERLGVSIDAPVSEVEQKYRELHDSIKTLLEAAPTTNLKHKYQSELQALQDAYETLCPSNQEGNDYPTDRPVYDEGDIGPQTSRVTTSSKIPPPSRRLWIYAGSALLICLLGAIAYSAITQEQEKQRAQIAAQKKREADEAARKQREADAAARSQREADEAAQKQREAEATQRQREADEAVQRQREADEAAQRQRESEESARQARAERARRQREQEAAERAHQAELQAAQQRAERAEAAAAAAQQAAQRAAQQAEQQAAQRERVPEPDPVDDKPKTGKITIEYAGDYFACSLDLRVRIGDKSFHPSSNHYRVSGVEVGDQDYTISGTIGCPNAGVCRASGSGSVDVSDGDTYKVVWANTSYGGCSVELQPD